MTFPSRRLPSQRGMSVLGMVILAIIVGFLMLMGARVFPSVNEYLTIRKVLTDIMHRSPAGPAEIRGAFEKASEVEYSIHTISGKDLNIVPLGDGFKASFDYNVEIPIVEPVYLLVKYSGSSATPNAGLRTP